MQARRRIPVTLALALAACGAEAPEASDPPSVPPPVVVRDSAGVRIVESLDSLWTTETAWRVEAEPALEIGSVDGAAPGTDFGRLGPVVRLPDGRIAVGDQQAIEVRVFASDGSFLEAWGGPGDGPGELRRVEALAVIRGDSLVVRNQGLFRHEVFGPDGGYGRTVRGPELTGPGGRGIAVGWLEDGAFVVSAPTSTAPSGASGRQRIPGEWHLFGTAGQHLGAIGELPARAVELFGSPRRENRLLHGPRPLSGTDDTGLWYAFSDRWELRRFTAAGLERIVRRAWTPEPVAEPLRERYREWLSTPRLHTEVDESLLPEYVPYRRTQQTLAESRGIELPPPAFANSLPPLLRMVVATDGHLWLESYATAAELLSRVPDRVGTDRWTVLTPEGRWLGTVTLPEGLRVTEIGPDYVLGVRLDELGVPFVRLHRIFKP